MDESNPDKRNEGLYKPTESRDCCFDTKVDNGRVALCLTRLETSNLSIA